MEDDAVKHVLVDARNAPPISTQGASSVFALADQVAQTMSFDSPRAPVADAGDDATTATPAAKEREQRALQTLESCGEMSCLQFAEAMDMSRSGALYLLNKLLGLGAVEHRKDGLAVLYKSTGKLPRGFKGWLKRKGETSAEGRSWVKPKAKTARAAKAPKAKRKVHERTPTPRAPQLDSVTQSSADPSDLECGLFSTGSISIAAEGQTMRLNRSNTRALIAWLDKVDQVFRAEDAAA